MSHDMLMLRGDVTGGFNLAVGEPVFLQQALGDLSRYYLKAPDLRYPPFAGTSSLMEALDQFHNGEYSHYVVTVGAKQALVASFHALKQLENTTRVYTSAPYWPSYPTLVKASEMQHQKVRSRPVAKDIVVNTSPNNPDGAVSNRHCDIWDAAYAHPVYGWLRDPSDGPSHQVAVYSGAKLFGLSGLRIGWLATNKPELARLAGEYVEKATSGVSTHDQYALEGVLRVANKGELHESFWKATQTLEANRSAFFEKIGDHVLVAKGFDAGMFAWFKPEEPVLFAEALALSNVKVIPGNACGGDPYFYRMSLGHDSEYTRQALEALRHQLEENAR